MSQRLRFPSYICFCLAILLAPFGFALSGGKKKVTDQSDLPRFTYPIAGPASDFVLADDATFNPFAAKVRSDLDTILRDYEIEDKATLRALLSAKLDLQELAGEYQPALETMTALRAAQDKPAAKLTTGIFTSSVLHAALDTKTTTGPAFEQAFTKYYAQAVNELPWGVVQDSIKSQFGHTKLFTKAAMLGFVKTDIDPAVQKSGVLDNLQAWDLIEVRNSLRYELPLNASRSEVLGRYIAAHNVQRPDIWEAREVTLTPDQKLTSVLVGIWDSGVDVSVFREQAFTDPRPTASGNRGLAYDDYGNPSTSWLYPITPAQQQQYPAFRQDLKGFLDVREGIDSPEAKALQEKTRTLSADQLHDLFELNKVFSHYVHGTHVAGIAARGNPAARIVVARFNDQLPDLPFAPTPEWARRMAANFLQMAEYFRTRNVRVVNMSWGDEPQEFEAWISRTGGGADPAERKRRANELFAIWHDAVENAIKSAPNTLFICAAGNSNSDPAFLQDVPPSLHLPNLIAVGAVNQAGDETSFTSYGNAVVVHANGYEVDSFLPGGTRMKLSGTSMASPNVTNLAAKLFALDPSLTPPQVIELIRKGATASEDGRRHLIDPKRSVALLPASRATR